jgi:hypothetical protein
MILLRHGSPEQVARDKKRGDKKRGQVQFFDILGELTILFGCLEQHGSLLAE